MDPHREWPAFEPEFTWPVHRKFQDRVRRHVLLFVLTVVMTTLVGRLHYLSFAIGFSGTLPPDVSFWSSIGTGFWYSATILAILGCHEFGHYFACRYYDVDASLPFFLPAPLLTGTLGAFIRIREPIPSKRMLFDIGIAGPIAGFAVAVPALVAGIAMSRVERLPDVFTGFSLGEPLLLQWTAQLFFGTPPENYSLNLHPMAFAAWFGLFATALNLFPIGQLDGGHICYAVFGRRSSHITIGTVLVLVALCFVSSSWIVWTGLTIVMLAVFGRHHPRVFDEGVPLDRTRLWLALFALVMFVVCFTPAPLEPLDLLPTAK